MAARKKRLRSVEALALRVIADRLKHDEGFRIRSWNSC